MIALLDLIDEHPDAVERELMTIGERLRYLGTDRLTWSDLKVVVSQAGPDSPIVRAINPDAYTWTLSNQLLAEAVDTLHWLQWAKTKGAQKTPPDGMPTPIKRPGVSEPKSDVEVYKFDSAPQDEMLSWLGWESPEG